MTDKAPAKLERPHQLKDLNQDQLVAVILRLTMEISVLRDRLATHECVLEDKGVVNASEIEDFVATGDEAARRAAARKRLIDQVLRDLESG